MMHRLKIGPWRSWVVTALMTVAVLAILAGWARYQFGSVGHALAYARGERLYVDEPVKSLGEVEAGRLYHVTFRLCNDSDRPVRIVGFRSSCGCTTASDLPMTIPPSKACWLVVRFVPKDKPKVSDTQVSIYTDHAQRPEIGLRLIANVTPSKDFVAK